MRGLSSRPGDTRNSKPSQRERELVLYDACQRRTMCLSSVEKVKEAFRVHGNHYNSEVKDQALRWVVLHLEDCKKKKAKKNCDIGNAQTACCDIAEFLLQQGASPNRAGHYGFCNLLHETQTVEMAHLLVRHGARVNHRHPTDAWTPLHMAVEKGATTMVAFLLDHGADVMARDRSGETPLHLAARQGNSCVAQLLLEERPNTTKRLLEQPDKLGNRPLHMAAAGASDQKAAEMVSLLLKKGAHVDQHNKANETPLWVCLPKQPHGDKEANTNAALVLMKHGANLGERDEYGNLLWHEAVESGDEKTVAFLLDYKQKGDLIERNKDKWGVKALHIAARRGHANVAQVLLDRGANVDARNVHEETPLHDAVYFGATDVVKLLLENNANVNARNHNGHTPLHKAASNPTCEVAQLLLGHGAEMEAGNKKNQTPLHWAAYCGSSELMLLLLERGAIVDALDCESKTPLHKAAHVGGAVATQVLLNRGAHIEARNKDGQTPLHWAAYCGQERVVKLLLNHGANLNAPDKSMNTPLHFAAVGADGKATARLLLDRGANLEACNVDSQTPLHLAAYCGRTAVVQLLTGRGASVDSLDKDNRTPLHFAAFYKQTKKVDSLLYSGASLDAMDNDGKTPLHHILGRPPHNCQERSSLCLLEPFVLQ